MGFLEQADICLVVPPYVTARYPQLGVPVLAGACRSRGLSVKQIYGNLLLAARLGYGLYESVLAPMTRQAGERLFVPHAYPPEQLLRFEAGTPLSAADQLVFDRIARQIGPFLEELTRQVLDCRPRIVGISSTFEQNLAAIAIARSVKKAAPDAIVVLGGGNISDPMGPALAGLFPWIDHFFAGEADVAFPDFCERVLAGDPEPAPQVVMCAPIMDMGQVSAPDFADYFDALRGHQEAGALPGNLPSMLPLESSRGCWWGAKHHCTFCGLNAREMSHRRKAPERVLAEVSEAASAWSARRIYFTDNIMPLEHFNDVLPALAKMTPRPTLFYEVKANLRDDQLDIMKRAGVDAIQPGIESLSTHTLKLMRKGVSGLQNMALLRACLARGMRVRWNYLYGFPGERAEDYRKVLRLMPKLEHLEPPSQATRIVIDRYSPFHSTPAAFEIAGLIPFEGYRGLFPPDAPLHDIAYHFWGDYLTAFTSDPALVGAFEAAVDAWGARWRANPPILRLIDRGGAEVAVADTRGIAQSNLVSLSRRAERALQYFERPRPSGGHPPEIDAEIDRLLELDFLIEHEASLISVVVRSEPSPIGAEVVDQLRAAVSAS
jgi:ribosomal peptide maturation radical SAM protein 1